MSWIRELGRAVDEVADKIEEGVTRTEAEIEGMLTLLQLTADRATNGLDRHRSSKSYALLIFAGCSSVNPWYFLCSTPWWWRREEGRWTSNGYSWFTSFQELCCWTEAEFRQMVQLLSLIFVPYWLWLGRRHIDGHDYLYAVSELLESAKECIFIMVRGSSMTYYCRS